MAREKTHTFQMRVSDEWMSSIDDWRRTKPEIPARAEAIRQLVRVGLEANPILKELLDFLESQGDHSDADTLAQVERLRRLIEG